MTNTVAKIVHATKVDTLQSEIHKLHFTIDSLKREIHDFGIASTYYHDIINTDVATFIAIILLMVTLLGYFSWRSFIRPLENLTNRIAELDIQIFNTLGQQTVFSDILSKQQTSIDFIGSQIKSGTVFINLISDTGEEAHAQGAIFGEGLSQPIGLPNNITLPFGVYKVRIIRYGYIMRPDEITFEVNKLFTTIDIPVKKSPPMT